MNTRHVLRIALTLFLATSVALQAQEAPPREGVTLTIYNNNFVLVKDVRTLDLGQPIVSFRDVAATIDATSVHFRSLDDPTAKVQEQNYEFDLVSSDKLLDKYIDKPLTVFAKDGKLYEGILMSFDAAQLVLAADKEKGPIYMVQRGDNIQRIQFGQLPEGLLTRPTLVWEVTTAKPGPQRVELSYIANNMRWRSDYNITLSPDDTTLDLSGWVTVENSTGTGYADAVVKLVADSPKVDWRQYNFPFGADYYKTLSQMAMTPERGEDKSRALGEFRVFDLPVKTTVNSAQVKQVELIKALAVPGKKIFVYDGSAISWTWYGRYWDQGFGVQENKKVNVLIEFENRKENSLGIALPGGKARVYKADTDKSLEFIGEDMLPHTPRQEKVTLYIGDAFDIVGERKQTKFNLITPRVIEETFEVKVRNRKEKEAVTVNIIEKMYRWTSWKVQAMTLNGKDLLDGKQLAGDVDHPMKKDWRTVEIPVELKPDEEGVLVYTVRYTW